MTVGLQHYAPGAMRGIGALAGIPMRPIYRFGAERSAVRWADSHGVSRDSAACHDRAEEILRHEMDHLPQAAIWSLSAAAGNVASQKWLIEAATLGHLKNSTSPWWQLGVSKMAGASVSVVGLLGARALAPAAAGDLDRWTGKHLYSPMAAAFGRASDVDAERSTGEDEGNRWRRHLQDAPTAPMRMAR